MLCRNSGPKYLEQVIRKLLNIAEKIVKTIPIDWIRGKKIKAVFLIYTEVLGIRKDRYRECDAEDTGFLEIGMRIGGSGLFEKEIHQE